MSSAAPARLKIAIAVHGRFHAFDLARELLKRGHDVTLLTNYPKYIVQRFGVPAPQVKSLLLHGIAARLAFRLRNMGLPYPEVLLHRWFGRWVAAQLKKESWDVALCWSGIGEEAFRQLADSRTLCACRRGSSHIRMQARLLEEEEARSGVSMERPTPWMIAREEREYDLADVILGNSSFVAKSMVAEGIPPQKAGTVLNAVQITAFRASPEVIEARRQRILRGDPLRVLNVGTFSFQKGMLDMGEIIQQLSGEAFQFRFVGPIASECQEFSKSLAAQAEFITKQPQNTLPEFYAWGDIFVLPTIQDGYPMVSAQAAASGLPILITTNSSAYDLVTDDVNGWVLPIRAPQAFIEKLQWCHENREALAKMVTNVAERSQPRDWADAAADLEQVFTEHLARKRASS